jgi:cysteine desulfurase
MISLYFDSAATTPTDPSVWAAMHAAESVWGNSGSKHVMGHKANKVLEASMAKITNFFEAKAGQIVPTHGGTDANRRVLWMLSRQFGWDNLFCSRLEHASIADEIPPAQQFDPFTFEGLPADPKVIIAMAANNETGVLLPIKKLRTKYPNAVLVSDWVQALGKMPWTTQDAQMLDIATFSAHKIHGPKGVGCVYLKEPARWESLARDSHTKSVHQIVGMAAAFDALQKTKTDQIKIWSQQIESAITASFPAIKIHHADKLRVPGIISVAIPNVRGAELMMQLSEKEGIATSTGSACTSDILRPTRIIEHIEINPTYQYPIRIGLHRMLTQKNIDEFIEIFTHYINESVSTY